MSPINICHVSYQLDRTKKECMWDRRLMIANMAVSDKLLKRCSCFIQNNKIDRHKNLNRKIFFAEKYRLYIESLFR